MPQLKNPDQESSSIEPPAAMEETPRWLCYSVEERGGKSTKVPKAPRSPTFNAGVRSTDEFTDYETAKSFVEKEPSIDGTAFVLSDEDDIAFVDLDDCRDPETGEIDSWAQDIIDALDSYSTVSTSGSGVHVYLKGSLDESHQQRDGKIELYEEARFLAFTGDHLDSTPTRCCEREDELLELQRNHMPEDVLSSPESRESQSSSEGGSSFTFTTNPSHESLTASDEAVVRTAKHYSDKFERLWNGSNEVDSNDGHSASDASFCRMLAFWTREDAAQMKRIWRNSPRNGVRARNKVENRPDYVDNTVEKAIRWNDDTYSGNYR